MLKPSSLRRHLVAAVPELKRDPDKLSIFVRDGKIATTAAGSLSFEYRYTLNLVLLDYGSHADAIMVPVLAWLRENQPEIADNPELRDKSVRFDVEFLNAKTVDLSVELDLTERVIVKPRASTPAPAPNPGPQVFDVKHVGEPPRPGVMPEGERWEFYLRDELLAAWDFDPR
ncbi:MAG: phage tail protein [Roseateles depolymerans]|uniref:Phage tail protein n=1 Tax=Roseateles depolymerans TaxID=76731 RepID=A0A2W5DMR5_9BURK|nr:MAG: phage tail protein [Roseateles depolymerans]